MFALLAKLLFTFLNRSKCDRIIINFPQQILLVVNKNQTLHLFPFIIYKSSYNNFPWHLFLVWNIFLFISISSFTIYILYSLIYFLQLWFGICTNLKLSNLQCSQCCFINEWNIQSLPFDKISKTNYFFQQRRTIRFTSQILSPIFFFLQAHFMVRFKSV